MAFRAQSRIAGAAMIVLGMVAGGCADEKPPAARPAAGTVAKDTSHARRDTMEAGGDVVATDSAAAAATGVWLTDANVLALLATMNSRQIAAAEIELSTWHSDTIRAFAVSMAREHSALAHSLDSVATSIKLAPIAPALAEPVRAKMQAQIDSLYNYRGDALDRAFVREQAVSHDSMSKFVARLATVAQRPEVQGLLTSAAARLAAQAARARTLDAALTVADSTAADSAAKAEARRKRAAARDR